MTARQLEYEAYRLTPHWENLRQTVLCRDGRKCVKCGSRERLQAHHKFYRPKFEDSIPDDLITLCRPCHEMVHGIRTAPPPPAGPVISPDRHATTAFTSLQELYAARTARKISRQLFRSERERLGGDPHRKVKTGGKHKKRRRKTKGKRRFPKSGNHRVLPFKYVRNGRGGKWVNRGNSSN